MSFAENFNKICLSRNTNPTALCKDLGLSTSKVTAWNKGSLPKQDIMILLAQKLNCSVMDFFADGNEDLCEKTFENEDEKDIIDIYRSLSRQDKHEFMVLVYNFAKSKEGK